ncbi:Na(+)-translocating NADH-quinone reductase subunit C, partial [Haemophilus influenzae]
FYQFMALACGQ